MYYEGAPVTREAMLLAEIKEWVTNVNELLSKPTIDYDAVLSTLSAHVGILYEVPETKQLLVKYIRLLHKIALLIRLFEQEYAHLEHAQQAKIRGKNTFVYMLPDGTYYTEKDLKLLDATYADLVETFKVIARRAAYTVLAGIERLVQRREEEAPPVPRAPPMPVTPPQIPMFGGGMREERP